MPEAVSRMVPAVPDYEDILAHIARRYGSLSTPSWSFAARAIEEGMWDPLVADVRSRVPLEERTDLNNDVSRVFDVGSPGAAAATLQVSLVGPYGVYFRHTPPDLFIDGAHAARTDDESFVVDRCAGHGITLLGRETLSMRVPMLLFDTEPERVRVYQALFTDVDFLPGEYEDLSAKRDRAPYR